MYNIKTMDWEEYKKKLTEFGYKNGEIELIKSAFFYAKKIHDGEKRESGDPYFIHPIKVSQYVARLNLDPETIVAALLHDVMENQGVKIDELKKQFGEEIAFLVEGVTKVERIQYRGIERAVESLYKMFLATAEDIRVVIIKLMDRLHNMETLEYLPAEKKIRIAKETIELYAPLADRLGMWETKAKLEDLAFPYVYPEEYKWLISQIKHKKEEGERYLSRLKPIVAMELKKENIEPLRITYRSKHLFSIWKKLVKYEMNFDLVLDLVAIRIIVKNNDDCYRALGVIHKLWRPMPGRIKDYIALPKPNGYRSLHTTVFGPQKKKVDFQIRTEEMDNEAEHGIAAHWLYETEGKKKITKKLEGKKFSWVTELQTLSTAHKNMTHEEAMQALKIDFFKDRIFVLTPKGDVIDLPDGATPIDFAYHVHSEIGDHMSGVKVNGKMVTFSHQLKSGDSVEILTQKNKKPTSDWLDFAHTSMAKGRIRSFLRKKDIQIAEKSHIHWEATATAEDRVGLLKDYSEALAKLGINIVDVKIDAKNKMYPKTTFRFHPPKNASKSAILTSLKKLKNVENVVIKEVK